jgi:hypothetical protein
MYQITRNHVVEDLKVTDAGTGEELVLHVDLSVDQVMQRYLQAAEAFTKARNNASKGLTEERVEKLGEAILNLFVVIFGQEQAQKLVDFYGESYTEMLADVVPFINEVVAPKINEAQQRIMAQYQAAKVQRQNR